MPPPNPYMPRKGTALPLIDTSGSGAKATLVRNDTGWLVYHSFGGVPSQLVGVPGVRSLVRGKPLASVVLLLRTPRPQLGTTAQAVAANLWRESLLQQLSDATEAPALAGLKWAFDFNTYGVRLCFSGYAAGGQKLAMFVAATAAAIVSSSAVSGGSEGGSGFNVDSDWRESTTTTTSAISTTSTSTYTTCTSNC